VFTPTSVTFVSYDLQHTMHINKLPNNVKHDCVHVQFKVTDVGITLIVLDTPPRRTPANIRM